MTEAPFVLPSIVWWTACEVYTWVAFGEARKLKWVDDQGNERWADHIEFPRAEWSCDWVQWPPHGLSAALVEIGSEKRPPCEPDPFGLENPHAEATREDALSMARRLVVETRESAERLNELLAADIERCAGNGERLRQAYRDVMAAVRAGRLTVRARRTLKNGLPNVEAGHEEMDPVTWFLGPRVISISGEVEYTGKGSRDPMIQTSLESLFDYDGPRWDDARFIAGQVRALWPAPNEQPGNLATKPTAPSHKRLQDWLEAEMREFPEVSPGKAEMERRATELKYIFTGTGFLRAWQRAVDATGAAGWSKPGRKSKGANRKAK